MSENTITQNSTPSTSRMTEKFPNVAESEQHIVTLKVGPHQKVFLVHTEMICSKSEFFKCAFQSDFKEGKEQVMMLEDTEEDVFKVIMQYLYTHQLPAFFTNQGWDQKVKTDDKGNKELEWDFLMSGAYVFAKMYAISDLPEQIEVLFQMRLKTWLQTATTKKYPSMATIIRVFNGVPEDSRLCELFLQSFSRYWRPEANETIDKQLFQQLPLNFALLAMEALAKRRDEIQAEVDAADKAALSEASNPELPAKFDASFLKARKLSSGSDHLKVYRTCPRGSYLYGSARIY